MITKHIEEIKNLRNSINLNTNKIYTLEEIGKIFNYSRQRIHQIIGNTGYKNRRKVIIKKCGYCGKDIITRAKNKIFCNRKCFDKERCIIKGKPKRLYNKEERKILNKQLNYKYKESRKIYWSLEKNKKRMRIHNKKYYHRLHPKARYQKKVIHII